MRYSVLWCCQKVLSWFPPCHGASQQETSLLSGRQKGVPRILMGKAAVRRGLGSAGKLLLPATGLRGPVPVSCAHSCPLTAFCEVASRSRMGDPTEHWHRAPNQESWRLRPAACQHTPGTKPDSQTALLLRSRNCSYSLHYNSLVSAEPKLTALFPP